MIITGKTSGIESDITSTYGTNQRVHETLVAGWKSLRGHQANTRKRGFDLSFSHSTT